MGELVETFKQYQAFLCISDAETRKRIYIFCDGAGEELAKSDIKHEIKDRPAGK